MQQNLRRDKLPNKDKSKVEIQEATKNQRRGQRNRKEAIAMIR